MHEMSPTQDVSEEQWLVDALAAGATPPAVSSAVPLGYQSYLEIPIEAADDDHSRDARFTIADELLRRSPDPYEPCAWAMWTGWPQMHRHRAPTLRLPDGINALLFRGVLADLPRVRALTGGDATLWWPESRRWVMGRPVDSNAVYVACDESTATALRGAHSRARFVDPAAPYMPDL